MPKRYSKRRRLEDMFWSALDADDFALADKAVSRGLAVRPRDLMFAIRWHLAPRKVEYLMDKGGFARSERWDWDGVRGMTPLHQATLSDRADCLCLLIGRRPQDALAGDGEGLTPLMWAAKRGLAEMARALVEASELDAKDRQGRSALDLARRGPAKSFLAGVLASRAESMALSANLDAVDSGRAGLACEKMRI